MNLPAIPNALDLLRGQLAKTMTAEDVSLPLRALQLRGLSKTELLVHIERFRAANDATHDNEQFEENCLLALDVIEGTVPGIGLVWDAAHEAAGLLQRCLSKSAIDAAVAPALKPSDLLPPRRTFEPGPDLESFLAGAVFDEISEFDLLPVAAEIVRAPRAAFTSRPAAVLTLPDRVALEALVAFVDERLDEALPRQVLWPRRQGQSPTPGLDAIVLNWGSPYIVKADIANFYASIEHSLLAVFVTSELGVDFPKARAIEAMLTAVMTKPRGVPQGPTFSDVLASAYLLPVDRRLEEISGEYARYADDYYFPVDSIGSGRRLIQQLESLLNDVGLSVNPTKTRVMRQSTYEEGAGEGSTLRELKKDLAEEQLGMLDYAESGEIAETILEGAGVPDETVWNLLYHHTVDIDEVVSELVEAMGPEYAETYGMFFRGVAGRLESDSLPPDLGIFERLAREALALLASSDVVLNSEHLRIVLTWFPSLSPQLVRYLTSERRNGSGWVEEFIIMQLSDLSGIDWVDAWLCHAAGLVSRPSPALLEILHDLLDPDAAGPLSQAEAVRALGAFGHLREESWRSVFERAPSAFQSEMVFAGLGEAKPYAWLAPSIDESADSAVRRFALALEARPGT